VIEVLMPTTEQFAAHQRMAELPRIAREIGLARDDLDTTDTRAAEKLRDARVQRYHAMRKSLSKKSMTDAARVAVLNAAYRAAYPEKFTDA
jgi:glycerol dehydrogenase-like iron-containing ADH family enzyme